jgi:pyruvate-formate lyase
LSEQTRALAELKKMAESYGFDISKPATTAKEAVQWLYFGYLAGVKEQNGAAMSLGRTSTFSTSTSSAISRRASSPRNRPRRSSTTS